MSQKTNESDDPTQEQPTGWGWEIGLWRLVIMIQWIGLNNCWQFETTDNHPINHWLALYTRSSEAASMLAVVISPLRICFGWLAAEDIEEESDTIK